MSFERARAPMMSDAINFHNEDRTRHRHPFAPQPSTSMMGLPQSYSIYEKPTLELNTPKAKTKLIAESQGFSHTSSLGVHYVPPCIDPRYRFLNY
jgi:hypothetical protein